MKSIKQIVKGVALAAVMCGAVCAQGDVIDLNGSWGFDFKEMKQLEDFKSFDFKPTCTIAVPGCFDMMPNWLMKRGTGLYTRKFTIAKPCRQAYLVVDGMGLRGRFALDGKEVGTTMALPYSKFEISLGSMIGGEHTLTALVDNTFDQDKLKIFRSFYDFYGFGGFYHGVSIRTHAEPVELRTVYVRTKDYTTGTVELEMKFAGETKEMREANRKLTFPVTVSFDGNPPRQIEFKGYRATVKVPNFKLWSPESPNLHTVTVTVIPVRGSGKSSTVTERFGIRQVEAKNKSIYLNGKPIYLRGANRHEAHPEFGASTPEYLMVQDIQHLKAMGGNFFRGAHYPQSQRFLDLCDENGVLVWEESLGWGNSAAQMAEEQYKKDQFEQTRLMIGNSMNHPSVIIFGFQNENESNTASGKSLNDTLINLIKMGNTGRLITFACNHNDNDISNENTDLIAFNTYPGWIGSDAGDATNLKRLIREDVQKIIRFYRQRYPDKPIMVSEMGTCGVYGHHDPAAAQWTEEFQDEYVGDVIDTVFGEKEICGLCIWQFTDALSYHRGGGSIRCKPFAVNLAGILDGYRRPKLLAKTVTEKFKAHAQPAAPVEGEKK